MPGGRIEVEVVPDLKGFPGKLESGLKSASGIASTLGKGLGLAVAAGTAIAAVGLKNVLAIGIEYTSQLNTLQSVTQATGVEMAQVGNLAKQLGADMTLPATSAADAAAAMTELAKGGLSVSEAMTAAKGTLQLAAAAQIDAAQAAEIQSDALNQFGLAASEAGHVADLLANTANAASGEITDMAGALKFIGPVAKAIGADIDSVSTAVGLLAVQGIRGEQAGTSLRGIIASLAAPSKEAAKAIADLGIKAFDQTGKFVGLRTVTEQLAAAKGRMTEAEFAAAAATAFGNEGLTAASALASSGGKAFDEMATAVTRAGGASEVAAAKTKGLGGAWEGFKSQLETTGIEIFEAIDGPLEKLVRSAANFVDEFGGQVATGIETAVAAAELFGPSIASAISARAGVVGDAISDIFSPLASSSVGPLNEFINTSIEAFDDLTTVLGNVVDAAEPVAKGIAAVVSASAEGGGAVSAFGAGVGLVGDALKAASAILGPVGSLIGGLVSGFAELPGPVQSAAVALVAFKIAQGALSNTTALSTLRQFSGEMRVQQALGQQAGESVGRLGSAVAAFNTSTIPAIAAARGFRDQTVAIREGAAAAGQPIGVMSAALGTLAERSPAVAAMRTAFNDATEGAGRFGVAAGVAAAGTVGLRSAAGSLVNALGGPLGVAIAGVGIGLSILGSRQQEAAAAAQRHSSAVDSLANALRESSGAIDGNVRALAAKRLQEEGVFDLSRDLGISVESLTEAYLGNEGAISSVTGTLQSYLAEVANQGQLEGQVAGQNPLADKAAELQKKLAALLPELGQAAAKQKELDRAIASGSASMLDSTGSGRTLAGAMKVLASSTADADSRARALKSALDALSGGSISLEAAQARVEESLSRIGQLFGENVDKTKGWGAELINAQGGLNLTTENGRKLRDALQDLTTNTAEVASKTYDMARAQGDSVPVATEKARAAMQSARDAFISTAAQMGITAEQAAILADRAGLIPNNVSMVVSTPGSDQAKIELVLVKALLDAVPGDKPIQVRTLSEEAEKKLEELGFKVERTPNNVTITANSDSAYGTLNAFLSAPATKTVTILVNSIGAPLSYAGQYGGALNEHGNLLQVKRFAGGGFHKLTPMKGGLASIVPPNTWRIVGDRLKDDEAYIPINRSTRSVSLLSETAERMGYALARRYANGGIAMSGGRPGGAGSPVSISIDARGATADAVRALERSTIPKLTRMLTQQVGKRI